MGFFTFPGEQEHRRFNYRPIYYDKDEEERRQTFGHVDGRFEKEKEKGEYKPGNWLETFEYTKKSLILAQDER